MQPLFNPPAALGAPSAPCVGKHGLPPWRLRAGARPPWKGDLSNAKQQQEAGEAQQCPNWEGAPGSGRSFGPQAVPGLVPSFALALWELLGEAACGGRGTAGDLSAGSGGGGGKSAAAVGALGHWLGQPVRHTHGKELRAARAAVRRLAWAIAAEQLA